MEEFKKILEMKASKYKAALKLLSEGFKYKAILKLRYAAMTDHCYILSNLINTKNAIYQVSYLISKVIS